MSIGTTKIVRVRAPTRIDLGGGWTDVPPYSEREGGFVCNIAINRYATATLTGSDGAIAVPAAMDAPLVEAVLRRSRLDGVHLSLHSDFPVSAGLGGSSAASAALVGATAVWRGATWDPCEIAEEGRRIEVEELGIAGGRQDHYAATHGGALALRFADKVELRRIAMPPELRAEFARRSFLVYTGESRISGGNITEVLNAYEAREARVLNALARMRTLAEEMSVSLEAGDLDSLGTLVGEHWRHQRALHPAIPTPLIDEIVQRAEKNGALGAKAMGASGGGCVLVMARAEQAERVRAAVGALGTLVEFAVDSAGMTTC